MGAWRLMGRCAQGQATLGAEEEDANIVAAMAARDERRALSLLEMHLRHIEAGIRFDDALPVTGALSAALRGR